MNRCERRKETMRRIRIPRPAACGAALASLLLAVTGAAAQPRYDGDRWRDRLEEDCHFYAREQSYRYAPSGAGMMRGAARGVVGGAVFGAIVGGGRSARRGAVAGGALGAIAAGARNEAERDYAYRRAFDDCIRGERR
jgi:hypothetical protein